MKYGGVGHGFYLQEISGQVAPLVDALIHDHKSLQVWLFSHVWVVEAGVQHDDREGQHITGI